MSAILNLCMFEWDRFGFMIPITMNLNDNEFHCFAPTMLLTIEGCIDGYHT